MMMFGPMMFWRQSPGGDQPSTGYGFFGWMGEMMRAMWQWMFGWLG